MSARSRSTWHRCAWRPCGRRFRPYSADNAYCSHAHYSLAKRVAPAMRVCALAECGRQFRVGGTTLAGRRRPVRGQRFHSRSCASRAREQLRVRLPDVPTLPATRASALASALDGEGWVSSRSFVVEIGNTDRSWLRRLRRLAGEVGGIREELARSRPRHWKRFWRWRVYGVNAYALLSQCLPFLVVKLRRAADFLRRYRLARRPAMTLGVTHG